MNLYILLTTPLTDAGPFNLYSDIDGFYAPFGINVSKSVIENGYVVTAPNGTSIVRLISVGQCTNQIEVPVSNIPLTTTTTTLSPFSWYYGTFNSPGGVVEIPTSNDVDVSTGTLVTNSDPSQPITVPFNSQDDDFLWFATPVSAGIKSSWYVDDLNQGLIGGPANRFGNLFPDPVTITYAGLNLYLYISTGRTDVQSMTMS